MTYLGHPVAYFGYPVTYFGYPVYPCGEWKQQVVVVIPVELSPAPSFESYQILSNPIESYQIPIDPIIFSISFIEIRWYSLAYIIGLLLGLYIIKKLIRVNY